MRPLCFLSALSFLLHISGYVCMEIIGGNEATPHSRPYMVYLNLNGKGSICGGALIKPNWVITAAHCNVENATKALLGAHAITGDTNQQQLFKIKRAIKHPCFDKSTKVNDLQLLQLDKPAKMNKFVSLLQLPSQEPNVKAGTLCTTAGWGVTDVRSDKPSNVLREADLTIVDNTTCSKVYKKQKVTITSSMICAGPLKKRKDDACQGDSGGPLICDKYFTGLVSFGPKPPKICGNPKYPGVYTRLTSKYLTWIRDTIGGATL
ncbi:granzyme A-like [Hyperolius riggenbachi]|uniref:granzyme A-like n=1 Tax=Hyperolius riggenbachi TaxID=752182 RepID=UPI0035A2BE47